MAPLVKPRARVIIDNDFSGDPDDLFQTALGRAAQPVEVSNLVVYLASDESSYSTGSEFVVDGGTTAGLGHKDFSAVETGEQPAWVT